MSEAHELRVLTPSGLAQRIVLGGGGVSDNDAHFQLIPADKQKINDKNHCMYFQTNQSGKRLLGHRLKKKKSLLMCSAGAELTITYVCKTTFTNYVCIVGISHQHNICTYIVGGAANG